MEKFGEVGPLKHGDRFIVHNPEFWDSNCEVRETKERGILVQIFDKKWQYAFPGHIHLIEWHRMVTKIS